MPFTIKPLLSLVFSYMFLDKNLAITEWSHRLGRKTIRKQRKTNGIDEEKQWLDVMYLHVSPIGQQAKIDPSSSSRPNAFSAAHSASDGSQ